MASSPPSIILGNSIFFRPPEKEDLEFIRELWEKPGTPGDLKKNTGYPDSSQEDWYNNLVSPKDRTCFYCLVFSKIPEIVGEVTFYNYNEENSSANLFMRIIEEQRKKNFGRDTIELILHYFFFRWGGHVIYCELEPDNFLAQRILMKFGFEPVFEESDKFKVKMTLNQFIAVYGQEFT
jgi:RimJ/RimL family protein N-acetyltransferase